MIFSSSIFVFIFLPGVLLLHAITPRRWRNSLLFLASILFYAWGEIEYTSVMLACIFMNYAAGLLIRRAAGTPAAGRVCAGAVAANVAMLVWFKYANFIAENLNHIRQTLGFHAFAWQAVHLPLGISFFTFQAVSYVVDVYRGHVKPQRSLVDYAMYKSLFPQLIAGPIVRYVDVATEVSSRNASWADAVSGCRRFVIGLAKKMLVANALSVPADRVFGLQHGELSAAVAWYGIVCYALQIYFDFSGYSDMAIGMGRMLGFHFLENFNHPYSAKSLTDFWRRWHISLSTWFRDYVYIPLGGNRISPARTYANLCAVFLLCGLWHGASWTFIVWGACHGFVLAVERIANERFSFRSPAVASRLYLILVVLVSWVFFRADTLEHAMRYLSAMAGIGVARAVSWPLFYNREIGIAMIAGIFCCAPAPAFFKALAGQRPALFAMCRSVILLLLFFLCLLKLAAGTHNPFIYFRF